MSNANQPGATWAGPGDPFVVVAGHLVSPEDNFGEIGRMANGDLRRPNRMAIGAGGIETLGGLFDTEFGAAASVTLSRANGSEALPTAVLSGEALGVLGYRGHDGTAFTAGARIRAVAAENWAVGAHGTTLDFRTTPIGSAVVTDRWQMLAAGHLVAATDNVSDIGATGANRPRDLHIAGDLVVAGIGPHAIGGVTSGIFQMHLLGAFTSDGTSTAAAGLRTSTALTGAPGDTVRLAGSQYSSTIITQTAVEDVAIVSQASFFEPSITDNLTGDITVAATVHIANAPTEGLTNHSLFIQAGSFGISGQADGAGVGAGTLTNAPAAGDPIFWLPITINGSLRHVPAW